MLLKPRLASLVFCLVLLTLSTPARILSARQAASAPVAEDTRRGIELYRQGETREAAETLRQVTKQRPDDADAWHYLGLSWIAENKLKDAVKAFKKAVKLRPGFAVAQAGLAFTLFFTNKRSQAEREAAAALANGAQNADVHYIISVMRLENDDPAAALEEANAALALDKDFTLAYLLKSQALVRVQPDISTERYLALSKDEHAGIGRENAARMMEAAQNLEIYLTRNPQARNAGHLREQLEAMRLYGQVYTRPEPEREIFAPGEVTTKAVITFKPEPSYTEQARNNLVTGIVRLRVVLAADGTVKYPLVLRALSHGLTEKSIRAAQMIRFTPATKDGRPVSTIVTIEYNFNMY
jgi:tetratricopeptide (TPR) repeat protein